MNLIDVQCELFKRGNFSFITTQGDKEHKKQREALEILTDNTTKELLLGGAAGGAKSMSGAVWLIYSCLLYPGIKTFVGRETLKSLRMSTKVTIEKAFEIFDIPTDVYRYDGQDNVFIFNNGSRIDLIDLSYKPSLSYEARYGSIEYTFGWIEEGQGINFEAYDTLRTRVGRHYNDKYNLRAKLLVTCNPAKNWMYSYFYKPWKANSLEGGKRFLPVLATDNIFIESDYIEQLKSIKDKAKRERLLHGNWDYDDNPYKLCNYQSITSIFTNTHTVESDYTYYITADVARFGSDLAVIGVWRNWELKEVVTFDKSKTTEISSAIKALQSKYRISSRHVIADADGVGGGVIDQTNCIAFHNGATPLPEDTGEKTEKPEYKNIQVQFLVYLAEKIINKDRLYISADLSEAHRELIMLELDTIEQLQTSYGKIDLVGKAQITQDIGHSPDFRDMIFMRVWFDFKSTGISVSSIASMI